MEPRIAVCITVHNRTEMAKHTVSEWKRLAPANCSIFVVDDASEPAFPGADYRFPTQVGIAVAKNMCLKLADYAEHIFLSDDDLRPVTENWWQPYVYGTPQHACYIFGRNKLWKEPDYIAYDLPRGCLLYFTNHCVKTCGGYDEEFKIYAFEHPALSRRIFNMGLTPAPYIDVPNSGGLFYSHDEELTTRSSVPAHERIKHMHKNKKYFDLTQNSNKFIPYK